jgi:hypothetical protein
VTYDDDENEEGKCRESMYPAPRQRSAKGGQEEKGRKKRKD